MRTLYYVTDPMCSWCWGFAPVMRSVQAELAPSVEFRLVMGGLAPDSSEPMPAEVRAYVQSAWDAVEQATGAKFNRDFWALCEPRRSTWPACRAVLAAEALERGSGQRMSDAIQRAYYLQARNPSERGTLLDLAKELGFDAEAFDDVLDSPANRAALKSDLALRDNLGVTGFPTLCAARTAGDLHTIARGRAPASQVLAALRELGFLAE